MDTCTAQGAMTKSHSTRNKRKSHSTRDDEKIPQHKEQQKNPIAQGLQENPTAQGAMRKSHKQSPGNGHGHLGQLMGCPGLEGTQGSPWEGLQGPFEPNPCHCPAPGPAQMIPNPTHDPGKEGALLALWKGSSTLKTPGVNQAVPGEPEELSPKLQNPHSSPTWEHWELPRFNPTVTRRFLWK